MLDLTHLKFRGDTGSYGCYPKAMSEEQGIKMYYKCSNFYTGALKFGDESWYEVICSRLFRHLGLPCVSYEIQEARIIVKGIDITTFLCVSDDFARGYDNKITFENFRMLNMKLSLDDIISKYNFTEAINNMLIADFITMQRDRHGANIEVLEKDGKYEIAPLFDNGLTFFSPYPSYDERNINRVVTYDLLNDIPVNNYIGERSLYENLYRLKKPVKVNSLFDDDIDDILRGIEMPEEYLDAIHKMIRIRYNWLRGGGFIDDTNI